MQPGYQQGSSESMWWWMVAKHIDDAQQALANAMAHNVDDPRPVQALYGRLREGQAILLDIFRMKGLVPASPPSVPPGLMAGPGMPWPGMAGPPPGSDAPAEQGPSLAQDEPAVPIVDHAAAAPAPSPESPPATAPNGVHTEVSSEPLVTAPDARVDGAG